MSKIIKHESWNLLGHEKLVTIGLGSDLVILTGYNGVGKSTLLAAIHAAVTSLHEGRYLFSRIDWAQRFYLEENVRVVNARLSNSSAEKGERGSFKINAAQMPIKDIYKLLESRFQKTKKNKNQYETHGGAEDKESRRVDFTVVSNPELEDEAEISMQLNTILYCDELFYSNEEAEDVNKLVELDVISSSRNLDKTLYLLVSRFSLDHAKENGRKDLKKLVVDLQKSSAADNIPTDLLDRLNKIVEESSLDEGGQLLDEANLFFEQTGRRVVLGEDGLLELEVQKGRLVKWYGLSKGEKTLLCLLLITFLNRNNGVVYLFDEPDLSLHISWQEMLLPALRRLAPNSQFIVTTHSPAMVGNTSDELIVNLAGLIEG